MEALIGRARTAEAATYTEPDTETWIWSDLHLGHEHSRTVFGRPFRTTAAADTAMMEAWYEQVAEDESMICLGNVTVDGEALAQESPTPSRHVNVSVEQLNYRPARLSEIRRLARRLVEGRTVPRHSTRARLNVVERVMP